MQKYTQQPKSCDVGEHGETTCGYVNMLRTGKGSKQGFGLYAIPDPSPITTLQNSYSGIYSQL